jgi:hypothetical protein
MISRPDQRGHRQLQLLFAEELTVGEEDIVMAGATGRGSLQPRSELSIISMTGSPPGANRSTKREMNLL